MHVIELLSDSDEDAAAGANRAPAVSRAGGSATAARTVAAAGRGASRARAVPARGGAVGRGAQGRGIQTQPQSSSLLAHFSAEPRAPRPSVECPVCGGSFSSDKEVRMHVDWCLRNQEQQVSQQSARMSLACLSLRMPRSEVLAGFLPAWRSGSR
jgi:hypothetical protein